MTDTAAPLRRPVAVDDSGTPSRLMQATALALLLQATTAVDWATNHEAEWAALEGVDRIAKALGFAVDVPDDDHPVRIIDTTRT